MQRREVESGKGGRSVWVFMVRESVGGVLVGIQ